MKDCPCLRAPETCVLQSDLRANEMKSHRDGRRETRRLLHRATPARGSRVPDSQRCEKLGTSWWHSGYGHADNSPEPPPQSRRPTLSSSTADGVHAHEQWHARFAEKTVLRRIEKSCRPTVPPAIDLPGQLQSRPSIDP